jgi:hypothetical protein
MTHVRLELGEDEISQCSNGSSSAHFSRTILFVEPPMAQQRVPPLVGIQFKVTNFNEME